MAYYAVYIDATGPILRSGTCAADQVAAQANPDLGEQVITTTKLYSASKYYLVDAAPTAKVAFPGAWDKTTIAADLDDTATYSAPDVTVPVNEQVMFSTGGLVFEAWDPDSKTFTIQTDTPGNYVVQLDAYPYLLLTQTIKAI